MEAITQRLWRVWDWLDRTEYKAWGTIPAVARHRHLAAQVDELAIEVRKLRDRMLPVIVEATGHMREVTTVLGRMDGKLGRELARQEARPALQLVSADDTP